MDRTSLRQLVGERDFTADYAMTGGRRPRDIRGHGVTGRPAGAGATQLRETAWLTAREIQLTWLLSTLCGSAPASRPEPRIGVR